MYISYSNGMDFKNMQYMLAIEHYKNITKAAEALYITQSGLSQQLAKEEEDIGTPLFVRTKNEIRPTEAGKIYLENARRILKATQNMRTQIQDLSQNPTGTISLGLPFEHGIDLFIGISHAFNSKYPNVSITLVEQTVKEMQDGIKSDKTDLAFVMLKNTPPDDFEYIHLCTERLILGVPSSHPLAQKKKPEGALLPTVSLKDFANENFALMFSGSTMRQVIDPLFSDANITPNVHYETLMNNALSRLVRKGLACTILPQSYATKDDNVSWFYLENDPHWEWYIIYSKSRSLGIADQYFLKLASEYAKNAYNHWLVHGIGLPDNS